MKSFGKHVEVIWKDTKRWCGMPITFTHYAIIRKEGQWIKLVCEKGFLHTDVEEVNLYRVDDVGVFASVIDQMYGVGNVEVFCKDASTDKLILVNVKKPYEVKNLINDLVEEDRRAHKISQTEVQY